MVSELNDTQLDHFRQLLERRRRELSEDIRSALAASDTQHYADLAGQVGDLEDQALADLLVDENLTEIHRHIGELRETDAALMRIERGTYGECEDCSEPISPQRLEAYPTARRCIDCQSRYEQTHAQSGHPTL